MKRILFVMFCLAWVFTWSYFAIKATPEIRELINMIYTNIILFAILPAGGVVVKREVQRLFF